jgi:hypothetical protein
MVAGLHLPQMVPLLEGHSSVPGGSAPARYPDSLRHGWILDRRIHPRASGTRRQWGLPEFGLCRPHPGIPGRHRHAHGELVLLRVPRGAPTSSGLLYAPKRAMAARSHGSHVAAARGRLMDLRSVAAKIHQRAGVGVRPGTGNGKARPRAESKAVKGML